MKSKNILFGFLLLIIGACNKPEEVCVGCSALCAQTGFSQSGHTACAETREEAEKQATELMKADSAYKDCTLQCQEVQ